ncbi:hypothetical protein [Dongia deserti]|uniref:hypothetical protein n=1 Tax=Dongia deserti TaxID=2268030 RepID=UPI000E659B9D|nr:hypothetical protein [Dongia deserti]
MARMSDAAWLMGAVAAALLSGCASSQNAGTGFPEVSSTTAVCRGNLRAFGEEPSQAASLSCSGVERRYVAHADSIAHRYSRCAHTFESSGSTGSGTMTCSNGRSGPLTYDRTDPANIKVAAILDDGREMAFTLRQE